MKPSQETGRYVVLEGQTLDPLLSQNAIKASSLSIGENRDPVNLTGYGIYSGPFEYSFQMLKTPDSF